MDRELCKAAIEGNAQVLLRLVEQDELILDRHTWITTYLETPLHIAVMRGHEAFVSELLKLKPGLASELDSRQSSPLHLAALKGYVRIVRDLVQTNPDMCLARDRDGRNPVHLAAMTGRIYALKELVQVKPEAAHATVNTGKTMLHLCVEYSQFEALKLLVETIDFQDLVNSKDRNGNTALHLCIVEKQVETTELLLSIVGIEVNALNFNGMTPMDILIQRKMDTRDAEIEELLDRASASGSRERAIHPLTFLQENRVMSEYANRFLHPSSKGVERNVFDKLIKRGDDWLDKKRSTMMVVATLIASMAFQVGVNPPDKVWDKINANTTTSINCTTISVNANTTISERRGDIQCYLTIIYVYLRRYARFYVVNTTGFIASLTIILLLMSGLPLKSKIFTWILMVITWVAITAIALTYTVMLIVLTPSDETESNNSIIGITVFIWICLMILLLFGHTMRLLYKTIKMVGRALIPRRKKPMHQPIPA